MIATEQDSEHSILDHKKNQAVEINGFPFIDRLYSSVTCTVYSFQMPHF